MRAIFSNLGYVKLFQSESKMRQVLNASIAHLHEANMSVEETLMQACGKEKEMVQTPVLRAKDLLAYVTAVFCKFETKHSI